MRVKQADTVSRLYLCPILLRPFDSASMSVEAAEFTDSIFLPLHLFIILPLLLVILLLHIRHATS
jgi:hypothetical protein